MQFRQLGRTQLTVSELSLGAAAALWRERSRRVGREGSDVPEGRPSISRSRSVGFCRSLSRVIREDGVSEMAALKLAIVYRSM